MAKAGPEMLLTKVHLVVWSCRHLAKFPRNHRFTRGDRLEIRLYEVGREAKDDRSRPDCSGVRFVAR